MCPEEESILMTSFVDTLAHLHGREGKEGSEFDFQVRQILMLIFASEHIGGVIKCLIVLDYGGVE